MKDEDSLFPSTFILHASTLESPPMIHSIIAVTLLLLTLAAAWSGITKTHPGRALTYLANSILVNITPKGRATAVADAPFTQRYLIACRGAEYYSIAIAGQGSIPYAVVPDMTPTTDTDLSYPLPVNILGLNEDTERMIASGAINIDDLLTTDAGGLVRSIAPLGPGTYWVLGKAKTQAFANGDQVEVIPCFPYVHNIAQAV
jgi:hypothetical protein